MCVSSNSLHPASTVTSPPSLRATTLRVAEITQNSVRLSWNPLLGATGYILRWGDELGETVLNIFCIDYMPAVHSYLFYFPFIRYWSRCFCYAACCIHLLPGDGATSGPSVSLYCAAHICKWIWRREFCR